jgi:hypothetical protein
VTTGRVTDDRNALPVHAGGEGTDTDVVVRRGYVRQGRRPRLDTRAVVDVPAQVAALCEVLRQRVFEVAVVPLAPEPAVDQDNGRKDVVADRSEPLADLQRMCAVGLDLLGDRGFG